MKEITEYPMLPNATLREPSRVDESQLSAIGVNAGAFGIHEGDKISFDDDEFVVAQKINNNADSPTAYYISCTRNGKKSYVSASQLTRRGYKDDKLVYLGKLQETLGSMPSLKERMDYISGKSFVGSKAETFQFAHFENGIRTERFDTRTVSYLCEE